MLLPLFAHILVPLTALVAVAVIQFDKDVSIPLQIAETGTDLCILAIGATGSMFISPKLHEKFGAEWVVLISIMIVLSTVTLAGISIHVNRSEMPLRKRARVSCFLGAISIGLVCWVVIWGEM
jgi:MFS-type transporter involved in bile tolerance (Atg22 family)